MAELTSVSKDFYLHGFRSKHLDALRDQIRQRHSAWFALIETMNATAMEVMFALQTDETSSTAKVMAVTAFARAVEPFQAAAMLVEHGMVPEANACVRMTCEAAFALSRLKTDPTTFPQQLIDDHDAGRKALANSTLEGYRGEKQDAKTTERLTAVIAEINARFPRRPNESIVDHKKRLKQCPPAIKWASIATGELKLLYDHVYRLVCADGAHLTMTGLDRHYAESQDGQPEYVYRPHERGLPQCMSLACTAMLHALGPTVDMFALGERFGDRIVAAVDEWKRLDTQRAPTEGWL